MQMSWFKKHADAIAIMAVLLGGLKWIDAKMEARFLVIEQRLCSLEKDVAQIKTVLIIRGMMPESMAVAKEAE
jgi:hypothetical protein